jgi:hypothetical protein
MKFDYKRLAPLGSMLIFPLLGMIYQWVNQPTPKVYSVMTDLDRSIPLIDFFVLPYSIWIFYIYVCLVYFCVKDMKIYYRSLLTYTICTLSCYLIYSVFQTTVPRPYLFGNDLFTHLLTYVYNRDLPYNCFPSIHCFSCYMVMRILGTSHFRNGWNQPLIYGMSTLIIVSTFFVKQHAILDALAGFLLVEFVFRLIFHFERFSKTFLSKRSQTLDI